MQWISLFKHQQNKCKFENRKNISMFFTCSELTPSAPIPDGRMEQIMQPCGQPLLNQVLNWINFCWNSNFELNRNGYRPGLPPDEHHISQHYDITEQFVAVAIVLNCFTWYWFLEYHKRSSLTSKSWIINQMRHRDYPWGGKRKKYEWFPTSLPCIVNWQANTCGADVCLGNTNTTYWGSFEREGPLSLWILFFILCISKKKSQIITTKEQLYTHNVKI